MIAEETTVTAEQPSIALSEDECQARAEHEGVTRQERVKRLEKYIDELFPGEQHVSLRDQIRESFNVPQWGEYHNEGLFMDTHLDLTVQRIEAICGDETTSKNALEGTTLTMAAQIKRAVTSDREAVLRYAFLHDLEKRNTLGFNGKDKKGKRETKAVGWADWQKILAEHPDPVSLRAYFQDLKIDSIGYHEHGNKGADVSSSFGIDERIAKGIRFHELGFQKDVKTGKIRSRGAVDVGDIDFIIAVNFLDQSSSLRTDGNGDTKAMLRVEQMLYNIGVIQAVEILQQGTDLSKHDAEDIAKAVKGLEARSDVGDRLTEAKQEWAKILEAHQLKIVSGERLEKNMLALAVKRGLIMEPATVSAIITAITDIHHRVQPDKTGSKVIFSMVPDKKLAAQIKTVLLEAITESLI